MSHALLTGTLEKLEGKDEAREYAAAMASNILTKKAWVNHRRCEVEQDLDSTSLYLLVSCSKDPIHIALAKSWVTRTIANSDGGLATLGLERFSFCPGEVSLPTMKAAFKQLKLDVAYPRERLNHSSAAVLRGDWVAMPRPESADVGRQAMLSLNTGGGMGKMREGRAEPPDFGGAFEAPDGASRSVAITSCWGGYLGLLR